MSKIKRTRLEELKIQASILLKNLRSDDGEKARKAAERFLDLPFPKFSNADEVIENRSSIRLKHALTIIALENVYGNWELLKNKVIMEDCLFHNAPSSFLNVWFNNYEDAKHYQKDNGGYLLQYRKDYVISQKEYIEAIDLGEMEEEWSAIGYDWANPDSKTAWDKLFEKAKHNYLNRKAVIGPINKDKRPKWLNNTM
ncbi:MAG TPA: hypothetical protein VN721_03290 [Flavipsychrobacter sp.]|nr:hypothetical protein [Flavipsychrobacter sp.]